MKTSDTDVFKKLWWIVFKPLYFVMLAVLAFRTTLLFVRGEAENVTFGSVLLGLVIATIGIAIASAMIVFPFVKHKK